MDKLKIMVVDDESRMRKLVKDFLKKKDFEVIEAADGEEALDIFFKDKSISLIICDVMMPKINGFDVVKEIRQYSQVTIIMLTAKGEESDELNGFDLGVDEYISKPFSPKILVARVEAILRRSNNLSTGEVLKAGGIELDIAAHEVRIDGKEITLSFKEFELLNYFVVNQGVALSREKILNNVSFTVKPNDKIAIVADNENAKTVLFQIIAGEMEPDEGKIIWGTTITNNYFPKDNNYLFQSDLSITDWLRQYSKDPDETYVRSFLGRMLFSGEEALKAVNVLSGGEKVRCVLAKMMLSGANFLIMDEPTNHLDMESITALNDGMVKFPGNMIFTSHDHQLMQTVANRIIDIKENEVIDREVSYDEYLGIE